MRCLVTGGAGFIGSNLVDALVARGDEVVVIDNLTTGRRDNLDDAIDRGVELVEADIRELADIVEIVQARKPEAIFHLAARIDVRRSIRDPAGDAEGNVLGTINMLEAARTAGVGRFVNTSTGGAIYGDAETLPTSEAQPPAPKAPYGQSKLAAEGYCELFNRLHGLSTVTLRYGNVYGPRQDPLGEAGVMAIYCGRLLSGGQPTIYGDGLQTRDYVYVGDVIGANLAAATSDSGGAFNVGRGVQTTIMEVVEALAGLGKGAFEPRHAPERQGEVRRSALDASRAEKELGWRAEVSVPEGLARTIGFLEDKGFAA